MNINVEWEGLPELQGKLQDPKLITEPLQGSVLEPATSIGVKTAIEGIDGGTGIATRSIAKEVQPMMARVYTAMPVARAMSIEKGRPVGTPVEQILVQLIRWRHAIGHPDAAIIIAQEIRDRGVKGKYFMRGARDAVSEALPRLLNDMGRAIQERFER